MTDDQIHEPGFGPDATEPRGAGGAPGMDEPPAMERQPGAGAPDGIGGQPGFGASPQAPMHPNPAAAGAAEPEVATAEFGELKGNDAAGDPASLSMLYDLTLPVSIELGRARMSVEEVLSLGRGSVIQLDRLAGEPIDVLVGERRFAEGEVVVVGEQFGVRITRITNPNPTAGAAR